MLFLDADYCKMIGPVLKFVKTIITLIQYAVPIVIIILGSIDLFKAVVASKEDEIKAAQKLLIKRVIYGVLIFFLVTIVMLIFNTLASNGNETANANNWISCWNTK